MKKYNKNIGAIVKQYRVKAEMTQLELANHLGYDIPQFISLIENGHSKLPLNVVSRLIQKLHIPEKVILDALVDAYEAEAKDMLSKGRRRA